VSPPARHDGLRGLFRLLSPSLPSSAAQELVRPVTAGIAPARPDLDAEREGLVGLLERTTVRPGVLERLLAIIRPKAS
jgi:hypothetical protein